MTEDNIVPIRNRMTEADFERERQRHREVYGSNPGEANGRREQDLARLFWRSGWTQEELARKEGRSQSWVARRLQFGRVLNNMPMGINVENLPADLTERKFRQYWEAADKAAGNERQRGAAVLKAIIEHTKLGPLRSSKGIPDKIMEAFGDGRWHTEQQIVEHFSDEHSEDDIRQALSDRANRNGPSMRVEREKHGRNFRYRIFQQTRLISASEISAKLRPLIEGLKEEGKKRMLTISIGSVARLAALLERQIDEWAQDPAADAAKKEKRDD